MGTDDRLQRQRDARRRRSDQRRRAGVLRSRVIAISVVCFGLLWAAVFVQMATGNDPVLGDGKGSKATRTASTARESEAKVEAEPSEAATEVETEPESTEAEAEAVETEPEAEAGSEFEPEALSTGQS